MPHSSCSQSFHSGTGSKPWPQRRGEIMQADNPSRQSITLMACTMMPLRFLTSFRLLQLSICIAGEQKIWASGYLCFLSSGVQAFPFCPLFSSASKLNDETKSVASVQVTGLQQAMQFAYIAPATLTSFGHVRLSFLFCVSASPGFSFSWHRTT